MMRHRTTFPANCNFHGWWVKSTKGRVAQLIRDGRDTHDAILYHLRFNSEHVGDGNGVWTTEKLVESGCVIRLTREQFG